MALQDHWRVMNRMTNEELILIKGGATSLLTATFLNAAARCINVLLDIGRAIGTSIRRIHSGNICP